MSTQLSVSTWSLHRTLGPTYWDRPANPVKTEERPYGDGKLSLLELPAKIAEAGIHTLEICHFHLPTVDASYLNDLRSALDNAGVRLFSLLIDEGDITHPENNERDKAWIADWLKIAGKLSAERARIVAGKTTGEQALKLSYQGLDFLAKVAEDNGVRPMTENWFDVFGTPEAVNEVMDKLEGRFGLCLDFGNWRGADKYAHLASIAKYAESCHAKCGFTSPFQPDETDYQKCLEITREHNFSGPYTLIYDGPDDDEWTGLRIESELVKPYLN